MEHSQQQSWVQVIGRVVVHRHGHESRELTGATRSLLSILVAAGPAGAPVADIAACYWTDVRPDSWRVALRVSASHLNTHLPDDWNVADDGERFVLVPGDGFVDAWRIEQLHDAPTPSMGNLDWVSDGDLFADVRGLAIVDTAAERLAPMVASFRSRTAKFRPVSTPPPEDDNRRLLARIGDSRRSILLASSETHAMLAQALLTDDSIEHHVVVGDDRLLLPMGPFAMTFPELRNKIKLEQGVVEMGSAAQAFRVVSDAIAAQAASRPQRLVVAEAHKLDAKSLKLASFLIDQGRLADFSLLICGDPNSQDIRWLDFIKRSVTAGCDLIEPDKI